MRELEMQQQQQQERQATGTFGAQSSLSRMEFRKLSQFEHANESPRWQQLLDEVDAYRHGEGRPPVPRGGMMNTPEFKLELTIPRHDPEPINWRNWGGKPKLKPVLDPTDELHPAGSTGSSTTATTAAAAAAAVRNRFSNMF
jgi:hypothetical protein